MNIYFLIGMFSSLSLNTFLTQVSDSLLAGTVSLLAGVLSSIIVAWLQKRWHEKR